MLKIDLYRIIREFHESCGHPGVTKTYSRIASEYYWRNMQLDIRMFVRCCKDCQQNKTVRVKTRQPMLITDTPSKFFEVQEICIF